MRVVEKYYFFLAMITGILIGGFLRIYHIGSQIIWDDEWHGIYSAGFNNLKYIFTHFHLNDNCIPLTIYYRIMLNSIGLNEIVIRLPQLLFGILILLIFPLIVKKLFNKRIALIFLFLIAISPLLIYFSRFARPYSIVVFLSFISIISFYLWIIERKVIYVAIYLVGAILAPYFSLSSLAFVLAPVLYIVIISLTKQRGLFLNGLKKFPRLKHIAIVFFILTVGISAWLLPAAESFSEVIKKSGKGFVDIGTLGGCATLFSGSRSFIVCLILLLLSVYGLFVLYGTNKLLLNYFCIICTSQFFYIILPKPFLSQKSIIFTRYFLPCLPVYLLIISVALNELSMRLKLFLQNKIKMVNAFSNLTLASLVLILFLMGPIPDVYSFPNGFTNHKDFQYNYIYLDQILNRVERHKGLYPEFYANLTHEDTDSKIIEFPAILSWTWNIFHVYQRVHKKRVLIGYDSGSFGPFFGYAAFRNKKIGFNNFIDISDPKSLSGSGAKYIVIHKNIWKECAALGLFTPENRHNMENRVSTLPVSLQEGLYKYVSREILKLKKVFGKAIYEDNWIVVYKISNTVL